MNPRYLSTICNLKKMTKMPTGGCFPEDPGKLGTLGKNWADWPAKYASRASADDPTICTQIECWALKLLDVILKESDAKKTVRTSENSSGSGWEGGVVVSPACSWAMNVWVRGGWSSWHHAHWDSDFLLILSNLTITHKKSTLQNGKSKVCCLNMKL